MQNKLFTDCQSGFMPCDSCVLQLLSITHVIYRSFDCNPPVDVTGALLDIWKALELGDWHDGLIFKLQTYDVDGKSLKFLKRYLKERQKRILLKWTNVFMEKHFSWCSKRICFGSISVPNIYKSFT